MNQEEQEYQKEIQEEYEKQVANFSKNFASLTEEQKKYFVEVMGEIQGLINAKRYEEAIQMAQSVKDCITYPIMGHPPAVFGPTIEIKDTDTQEEIEKKINEAMKDIG